MAIRHAFLLHIKSFLSSPLRYVAAWLHYYKHGTQTDRWSDLNNFNPAWDERTAMMATMIAPKSSVLEFGAGREQLVHFLPTGCSYQPSDLVQRSPQTLVCDLNVAFPNLPQHYDVIVLSGVIEYIRDLSQLFANLRKYGSECIVSYASTNQIECITTRIGHGWINHLSETTLTALFEKSGFHILERKPWTTQIIYKLG